MEELIFRYQIYQAVSLLDIDMEKRQTIFLIFSSLIFTFSHIPRSVKVFVEKLLVGGLLYSFIYIVYTDVLMMILIHIFHNFFVVLIQEYERQGDYNDREENRVI